MTSNRKRDLRLDWIGVGLLVPLLFVPIVTSEPLINSLTQQVTIGIAATVAVYVMLRMGLLSFTVPAFMAVGGYAAAILAKSGTTELLALLSIAFVVPALIAIPLGALVLRLKGIYFIFITFIVNEILQLVLFETPTLTGGANGISAIPAATFFGADLGTPSRLVLTTVVICLISTLIALAVTQRFRAEFTSIDENQTLAESLGVAVWKYRTIGFVVSAGVSGLAGFALVNMLSTAHPSSFASWSVNNYIAYAFIGGRGTLLGIVVGSALLIVMGNVFSSFAHLSAGLFGVLLLVVMMAAPSGLVGTCIKWMDARRVRFLTLNKSSHDGRGV